MISWLSNGMGHLKKDILQWQQKYWHFHRIYNIFVLSTLIYTYWCQNMEKSRSKPYHKNNITRKKSWHYMCRSFWDLFSFKESLYDLNKWLQLWLWFRKALQHIFNPSMILACPLLSAGLWWYCCNWRWKPYTFYSVHSRSKPIRW